MAKVRFDMVAESSTTTGTGNFTVAGAKNPGRTLATAGVATSDTFKYRISHDVNNEWEVGLGTLLTSTTFSRSVLFSSNSNSLVSFSAGNKTVELVVDSADLAALETRASTTEVLTGTDVVKAVTADAVAALWEKGTDNSGGATITLGDGYQFDLITSTTTITALAFTTDKAGRMAQLRFTTSRQVTHNATTLQSPTAANLLFESGDMMLVESLGSGNFRIVTYWRKDVVQNLPGVVAIVANAAATALTTNLSCGTFTIPAGYLRVQSVYRFFAHYVFVRAATVPTITIEVLVNGSVVETLVLTFSASATSGGWVEALMVCRTTGGTGTVMVTMTQASNGGTNIVNQILATTGTAPDTIDTTVARSIEMRMRMTTAVASNTLTVVQGLIEKVN
jgi:hypothetical protein